MAEENRQKELSPEMQGLVKATLNAKANRDKVAKVYKQKVQAKVKLDQEVRALKGEASKLHAEYAKLWQVTKDHLPKE